MMKIFLSSTFSDLINERNAVQSVIHRMSVHYVGMEYFGSFAEPPIDKCLLLIRQSDILILLIGSRYGYCPDKIYSMTEIEYNEAIAYRIPVLAYFSGYKTYNGDGNESEKSKIFQEKIKEKHGVTWFSSPEDLAWKVACDIAREFGSAIENNDLKPFESVQNEILLGPIKNSDLYILANKFEESWKSIFLHYALLIKENDKMEAAKYLVQFKDMHTKHINALKTGNIIEAHNILLQLFCLSYDLEMVLNPTSNDTPPIINHSLSICKVPNLNRLLQGKQQYDEIINKYIGFSASKIYSIYAMSNSNEQRKKQETRSYFNFAGKLAIEEPSPACTVKIYETMLNKNLQQTE